MKELISMVDFVLNENATNDYGHTLGRILNYADFLNTPLNIGMFVPAVKVGDKWEVLEEPENFKAYIKGNYHTSSKSELLLLEQYQKAKDNVIFEGDFTHNHIKTFNYHIGRSRKIEYLVPFGMPLTKKGLEISGLNK